MINIKSIKKVVDIYKSKWYNKRGLKNNSKIIIKKVGKKL